MEKVSRKTLEARRDVLLKRLAAAGPFVQGSLCTRKVKCGKPGCRCARGELHEACVLTRKVRGRTVTTHVPRDLRQEVDAWTRQYRQLRVLLREISQVSERIIRIHVRTNRAAARNRSRRAPTRPRCTGPCSGTSSPGSSAG